MGIGSKEDKKFYQKIWPGWCCGRATRYIL